LELSKGWGRVAVSLSIDVKDVSKETIEECMKAFLNMAGLEEMNNDYKEALNWY
jgi:hypothetical protein